MKSRLIRKGFLQQEREASGFGFGYVENFLIMNEDDFERTVVGKLQRKIIRN